MAATAAETGKIRKNKEEHTKHHFKILLNYFNKKSNWVF
jgi:hypothetical protein